MTEQKNVVKIVIPSSRPSMSEHLDEVFGKAIDVETGQELESVSLGSLERVLKALGYKTEDSHVHQKYKRFYKDQPYKVVYMETTTEDLIKKGGNFFGGEQ